MKGPRHLAEYPFTPRFLDVDGHRLAYLDEGSGPAVVMVHGNPSWSYLYRNLVMALRDRYRCIVPDHLGCGFSDKPQRYPYRLHNHLDNLDHLLAELDPGPVRLIVHDWGGAIGMGWAGRYPEQVAGAVLMNTAAFPSTRIPLRIKVCRWPLLGALLVRGLNGFAGAAVHMAVNLRMRPEIAAGFLAPYDSWRNRIALHRFVQDIPMGPKHPSWTTLMTIEQSLATITCPLLLCWGGRDFCFDRSFYEEWQHRFTKAEAHLFPESGHYLLEDAFVETLPLVERFLAGTIG